MEEERADIEKVPYVCYWKPHVCNSVYKNRYDKCSESCNPIYKQSKESALESSQVDSQVPKRY